MSAPALFFLYTTGKANIVLDRAESPARVASLCTSAQWSSHSDSEYEGSLLSSPGGDGGALDDSAWLFPATGTGLLVSI